MQSILYHNSSGDQAFTGKLKRKEVHRAITLHPVKSPPHMYRVHNYMRGLKIQDLQQKRILLHRDIQSMVSSLGIGIENIENYTLARGVALFPQNSNSEVYPGDTKVLGVPPGLRSFKPQSSEEVIPWNFISRSEYSLGDSNPRRRIHSDVKEGLEDITREVMTSINSCSRQRGRIVEERTALYGYRRVDFFGADTILDLLLEYRKYRGRKVTLPVRRHIYLHQHFTGLEIREVIDGKEVEPETKSGSKTLQDIFPGVFLGLSLNPNRISDSVDNKIIHFILPLSGRYNIFERFLKNYEEVCISSGEKTKLLVILFPHKKEDSFKRTINLISNLKYRFPSAEINVIPNSGNFSRAKALDLGVATLKNEDLMFFIDVDIVFTRSALVRIRLNTAINFRIYFPIVFSQYDPNIVYENQKERGGFLINDKNGYWRQFGFGIVTLYKADYKTVGGFDLSIQGWGKEDVDFYEKAVKSDLVVFRAPDRNLIHVYHGVECDSELSDVQLLMCKGTRADTYAGTEQLADFIHKHPDYLRYAKLRRFRNSKPGQ